MPGSHALNDRPPVLVFDVNETLIDIESMAPLFDALFGDRRVLREWFNTLVMYSMTVTLSEHYVDFATLAGGVLRMLGTIHQIPVSDDDVQRVMTGMLTMPAHPDSVDGLTRLRARGFRLVSLTNSPQIPGIPTALDNSGLSGLFERQLSVDACQAFKPAPAVYRHVCQELDVAPADCMMVASHVWDLLGARNVGFSTALITRAGNAPLAVDALPQPAVTAGDLRELARYLLRPGAKGKDQ